MSREDDFSISELRRKRDQQAQQQQQPAAPQPPMGGGGGAFTHRPAQQQQPTYVGLPPQIRPVLKPVRKGDDDEDEEEGGFQVDIWRMLGALKRQWKWIALATLAMGLLGFAGGYHKGRYTVAVKLIRRDVSSGSESFKVETLTPDTVLSYIRSWDVARRVEAKAQPPISAVELMQYTTIEPEKGTDLVVINLQGKKTNDLVHLANLYATETVDFTKDIQLKAPKEAIAVEVQKAEKLANDIRLAEAAMVDFSRTNGVINPKAEEIFITKMLADLMSQIQTKKWDQEHSELKLLTDQLSISMRKLDENRRVYTPQHPEVLDNLTNIVRLESQIRTLKASRNTLVGSRPEADPSTLRHEKAGTTTSQTLLIDDEVASMERDYADLTKKLAPLSEKGRQYAVLDAGIIALNGLQSKTAEKLILLNQYVKNAEGYFRISRPATPVDVDTRPPMKKAKGFGTKGAMAGLFLAAALVLLMELKDRTMKTVAEVERVTGLRVLASLGNLDKMTPGARDKWAFRAWTVIAGQLNTSANRGMVCGFISSGPGEGRSTWIKLLGEAATRRGLRVLTVATKPSGTDEAGAEAETVANEKSFTEAVEQAMAENLEAQLNQAAESDGEGGQILLTLSASALAFPAEVVNQFNSGNLPAAHIPLPGWVWNRERRQQWQLALSHWMAIDNLVLLVELPPASMPESLLLAENLPQIIWLADSGKASISDTKEQLDMMRHAKCHIVGAVLNHEPDPIIKL